MCYGTEEDCFRKKLSNGSISREKSEEDSILLENFQRPNHIFVDEVRAIYQKYKNDSKVKKRFIYYYTFFVFSYKYRFHLDGYSL